MIDFHSHFLHGIDDGADTLDCSLRMLDVFNLQNIGTVVATPHYYSSQESVEEFLLRRNRAYNALKEKIDNSAIQYPEIVLGAEVALTPDIAKEKDLDKLCLGDSNAILIELPYSTYSEWMTYAVYEIISRRKLRPVLAHFERFCTHKKMLTQYENLLSLEVKIQINADSFLDRHTYKVVKHLALNGYVDVLGSDAHNTDSRKSNFDKAVNKIKSRFGNEYLLSLDANAREILNLN